MILSIWSGGRIVANVVGSITPCPTNQFPEQHRCVVDRIFVADEHYEIYPSNGTGKHMHLEGISCLPDGGKIIFNFVETGYV